MDGLLVRFEPDGIRRTIQIGGYDEAGLCTSRTDEVEHLPVAVQGFGRPVFGDLGKQPMLNGIPLAGAGGIVGDGSGEATSVGQLSLDFGFPSPGSAPITAPRVGEDQDFRNRAIARRTFARPPGSDGMRVKRWGDAQQTVPRLAGGS